MWPKQLNSNPNQGTSATQPHNENNGNFTQSQHRRKLSQQMWKSTAVPHPRAHSTQLLNADAEGLTQAEKGENNSQPVRKGRKRRSPGKTWRRHTHSPNGRRIGLSSASKIMSQNDSNPKTWVKTTASSNHGLNTTASRNRGLNPRL